MGNTATQKKSTEKTPMVTVSYMCQQMVLNSKFCQHSIFIIFQSPFTQKYWDNTMTKPQPYTSN
jgi:hypothetical protein